jgi:hypothetical protein
MKMHIIRNSSIWAVALLACFHGIAFAQDDDNRNRGISAYWALNYDTAIEMLTPLAEAGDAESAYYLGMIHDPMTQRLEGFNAKYQADYHDNDLAWAWYKVAIDGDYDPAFIRGSYLATDSPLSKDSTYRDAGFMDSHNKNADLDAVQESAHASRLSSGSGTMNEYQRKIYKIWREDPTNLDPDSKYLYMKVVSENERLSSYINKFEKIEPTLEACGEAGDDLCYYYLGLIQLDAARKGYSDLSNKYLEAWAHFYLAEQMGNSHAAIYRYIMSETMNDKEEEQAYAVLAQMDQ